jgi:hypothetical protein
LSGKEYKPKSKSLPGAKLIPHLCARIRRLFAVDVEQFTRQTTGKIKMIGRGRRSSNAALRPAIPNEQGENLSRRHSNMIIPFINFEHKRKMLAKY